MTFIIEDKHGEIFGYYCNTQIVEKFDCFQQTDNESFEFNLQSKNNRLNKPMKFEINDLYFGGFYLYKQSDYYLIKLGNIYLYKENRKIVSHCNQYENYFNYHGVKNALCGKEPDEHIEMNFTPKRILVIQMK